MFIYLSKKVSKETLTPPAYEGTTLELTYNYCPPNFILLITLHHVLHTGNHKTKL